MTLEERLISHIKSNGAMRLDHFIASCLYDEKAGYYATREVFGAAGDFVTAPEISQIFGEICGLWLLQAWQDLGAPSDFVLLELGAGRGVWMRDMLRAASLFPEFERASSLHILENSPRRRQEQAQTIGRKIQFLDRLTLPPKPLIVVSNEFFDALPIRQFRQEGGGWLEAFIEVGEAGLRKNWQALPTPPAPLAKHLHETRIVEINEGMIAIGEELGSHIARFGGAALTIDYGEWQGAGDTLQALKSHKPVDTFSHLGEADLTAHIRFADLAEAMALDTDFMTQGEFLQSHGGDARLKNLCQARPELAEALRAGYQRLTQPEEMGQLFKVMINKGRK